MMEWWHEYLYACVQSRKANPERTAYLRLPFRGLDNWHKLLIQAETGYSINPLWTFSFPP